ncbi:lysophospholipid acyltransferase family protein [Campylobacter sp. faydin G-140]|uniref:lysophospholipid acyltransferase family protein n=1 Tax=Campylobacter anatolicus TaxID=2829105 RepID=UPI001B8F0CDD|nr:lysophospholipid acyltransferase family protein [Campylobacter anatolicus]MBR8464845.1 lysophospholipid acyltransferase family protein [Campylobacter anatolicus]
MVNLRDTIKKIYLNVVVFGLYLLIWLIFLTCKKSYTNTNLNNKSCIVLFWHGRLAMMSFAYRHWWSKKSGGKRQGKVIISDHNDGEIITRVINFFSIGTIRGSSSKGGAKALIEALREIKNSIDIIITPDGPRGPRHSVADGAIIIAQRQNASVQILNYEADSFWQLKSWDQMIVPKPFSTINFSLSEPFSLSNLDKESAKELIQSKLWQASQTDGGKSVEQNKQDFIINLKAWWAKQEIKYGKSESYIKNQKSQSQNKNSTQSQESGVKQSNDTTKELG